jgi:hypothetical protein
MKKRLFFDMRFPDWKAVVNYIINKSKGIE